MLTRNASNECQETVRWLWSGRSKFENSWTNLVSAQNDGIWFNWEGAIRETKGNERLKDKTTDRPKKECLNYGYTSSRKENVPPWIKNAGHVERMTISCPSATKRILQQNVKVGGRKQITFLTTNSNEFVNTLTERVNRLSDKLVTFQIDTGLICNVLPFNLYPQITKDRRGRKFKPGHTLIQHNLLEVKAKGKTFPKIERGRKIRHSCSTLGESSKLIVKWSRQNTPFFVNTKMFSQALRSFPESTRYILIKLWNQCSTCQERYR